MERGMKVEDPMGKGEATCHSSSWYSLCTEDW